jgi:hypothetical protein
MGWVCRGDLDHLALTACRVVPRPGTRRPLSTAADGFHIADSKGGVLIDHCEFDHTGDDCVNIHDTCCQGVRKTGPDSIVLVNNPRYKMRAAVGDHIELFHADYSPAGYVGTVTKVTFTGNDTVLEFAEALPDAVSPLSIMFNHRFGTCDVHIADCRFNFGRVLLSTRRATVERCDFDHCFAYAIQLHTEIISNLWAEGSGAEDILIRDNVFTAANPRLKLGGAVIYGMPVIPAGRTGYPLFRHIEIADNRFVDSRGPIVALASCQDVSIHGNRIEGDTAMPGATTQANCVLVQDSSDIRVEDNTWRDGPGEIRPGVVYDPATTRGLVVAGNHLAAAR